MFLPVVKSANLSLMLARMNARIAMFRNLGQPRSCYCRWLSAFRVMSRWSSLIGGRDLWGHGLRRRSDVVDLYRACRKPYGLALEIHGLICSWACLQRHEASLLYIWRRRGTLYRGWTVECFSRDLQCSVAVNLTPEAVGFLLELTTATVLVEQLVQIVERKLQSRRVHAYLYADR